MPLSWGFLRSIYKRSLIDSTFITEWWWGLNDKTHTEHVRQYPGCNKGKINVSFYYCYCFTLNVCSILLHSFSVFSKVIVTFLLWLLIGWVTLIDFLKLNHPEMSSTLSQCIFLMDYWILFVNNMIKLKKRGWGLIINSLKGSI